MKKYIQSLYWLVVLFVILGSTVQTTVAASGDLSILINSADFYYDKSPGDSVDIMILCSWRSDEPATNVKLNVTMPSEIEALTFSQTPTSVSGNNYKWDIGTINVYYSVGMAFIEAKGIIKSSVPIGSKLVFSGSVTGDVTDNLPTNNSTEVELVLAGPNPDLWVGSWITLEESESDFFLVSEQNVPINLNIFYANMSSNPAPGVTIVDTLPAGVEFISSDVTPLRNGQILTWNVSDLTMYDFREFKVKVKPTQTGTFKNAIHVSCNTPDKNSANNTFSTEFQVVALLPPKVLKPNVGMFGSSDTLIMGSNPTISGLARAGATVTLYEGKPGGGFGFESLNAVPLGSAVAGPDRRWSIKPTTMTEARNYFLYVRAEIDGQKSEPLFWSYWLPFVVKVTPLFDLVGLDLDKFVVSSGGHDVLPGALGTTSGALPDEDIIIRKTQKAPPSFLTDHELWKHHTMKVVVTKDGITDTLDLPISEVNVLSTPKTNPASPSGVEEFVTYEIIYVQKGFGPGAVVEVWCRPTYYDDNGNVVLAGLIFVKCHEILIDPAGYVYEAVPGGAKYEWPEVPPANLLIKNATVTTMVRNGDDNWEVWDAESTGQVNPQVTDSLTDDRIFIPGYFAFYVPSGQYQVKATADGFAEYVSPILTVVDEPVFHNCGMTRINNSLTAVKFDYKPTATPAIYTLNQNYPNPFNPTTTMSYYLPVDSKVSLKIYDMRGREIATLINNEDRRAGKHVLQFDGSRLASGVYFYTLNANNFRATKKFVLLK